eukprot:420330_1
MEKYKKYYKQFKKVHKIWKYYIWCYVLFLGSYLWVYADIIMYAIACKDWRKNSLKGLYRPQHLACLIVFLISGVCIYLAPLVLYTISSSKLNQEYT